MSCGCRGTKETTTHSRVAAEPSRAEQGPRVSPGSCPQQQAARGARGCLLVPLLPFHAAPLEGLARRQAGTHRRARLPAVSLRSFISCGSLR